MSLTVTSRRITQQNMSPPSKQASPDLRREQPRRLDGIHRRENVCRNRHALMTFASLATMLVLEFVSPRAEAFVSPQGQLARLSAQTQGGGKGVSKVSSFRRLLPLPVRCANSSSTRCSMRATTASVDRDHDGDRRNTTPTRWHALIRAFRGDSRLERARHAAVSWLRAARRAGGKRALAAALAFTLLLPSLHSPRYSSENAVGGGPLGGATPPAIELVLPSADNPQGERPSAVAGVRGGRERQGSGSVERGRAKTARATAFPTKAAFVEPWRKGRGNSEQSGPGLVATAVRAASRAPAEQKSAEPVIVSSAEALGSMITTVAENAREIAEEFSGHIQGAKRDVLVILLANALIIPLCKRAGLSAVLGFLAAGVVLGPNCLSIVSDVKAIEVLGEMGIVFFLFEMGLELSVQRLMAMKRDVFGMGLATFGVTAAAVSGVGYLAGLTGAQMIVVGGGMALSSSAFVLQLLRDRDDMGTRYGRACFGILLFQDLAVVPLLVAIPLLAGNGAGVVAALTSAATKAAIALGLIAFIGKNVLNRFFLLVAKSKSQEAFLAVMLLTVIALSSITEGLGLSGTLGAFLAGTLLSETKYTPQVEADIAPFRALLLGMFFMTVGFEIDILLCLNNLPLVAGLVSGLLAMKAAVIGVIALGFGLSIANAQQTGLLLSQGGEFAFVAFGMAERLGIMNTELCKLLLTAVALSMAATPALSTFSAWVADQMESRMGYDHYVGGDSESDEIRKGDEFVVVCGYGRIGRLVCELLGKKFIRFVAFDNNPLKAMEERKRGLPVFYGDVFRPEVLNAFNVGKAKAVICTLSDAKGTNKAVANLRREFPNLPIFARAANAKHQKRLSSMMDVVAMVPTLPEDSIIVSLPFGGAVLRSLGCTADEVNALLEDTRKKFIEEKGLENEEDDNLFEQLGISRSDVIDTFTSGASSASASDDEDASDGAMADLGSGEDGEDFDPFETPPAVEVAVGLAEVTAGAAAPGDAGEDHDDGGVSGVAEEVEVTVAAEVRAAEMNATALAAAAAYQAAAALEAAVASGDVVYPHPEASASVSESGSVEIWGEDEPAEVGEELATSVGSAETS